MKKLIALILALVLTMSLMPTAWACEEVATNNTPNGWVEDSVERRDGKIIVTGMVPMVLSPSNGRLYCVCTPWEDVELFDYERSNWLSGLLTGGKILRQPGWAKVMFVEHFATQGFTMVPAVCEIPEENEQHVMEIVCARASYLLGICQEAVKLTAGNIMLATLYYNGSNGSHKGFTGYDIIKEMMKVSFNGSAYIPVYSGESLDGIYFEILGFRLGTSEGGTGVTVQACKNIILYEQLANFIVDAEGYIYCTTSVGEFTKFALDDFQEHPELAGPNPEGLSFWEYQGRLVFHHGKAKTGLGDPDGYTQLGTWIEVYPEWWMYLQYKVLQLAKTPADVISTIASTLWDNYIEDCVWESSHIAYNSETWVAQLGLVHFVTGVATLNTGDMNRDGLNELGFKDWGGRFYEPAPIVVEPEPEPEQTPAPAPHVCQSCGYCDCRCCCYCGRYPCRCTQQTTTTTTTEAEGWALVVMLVKYKTTTTTTTVTTTTNEGGGCHCIQAPVCTPCIPKCTPCER